MRRSKVRQCSESIPGKISICEPIDARGWSQDELDAEIQTLADIPFDLEQRPGAPRAFIGAKR